MCVPSKTQIFWPSRSAFCTQRTRNSLAWAQIRSRIMLQSTGKTLGRGKKLPSILGSRQREHRIFMQNNDSVYGQNIGEHQQITQHFYGSSQLSPSYTSSPERAWNIPNLRNLYFTGREDLLIQLHERLQ